MIFLKEHFYWSYLNGRQLIAERTNGKPLVGVIKYFRGLNSSLQDVFLNIIAGFV
jgi:hypothetical protein